MKTFKQINFFSLVLFSILLFFTSCHYRTIKGSGNVSSETRSVSDFKSIEVSSALKVVYTEGSEYKVEIIADDNFLKYITTELHGEELQIGIEKRKSFKNITKAEIHITSPSLNGIEASGASVFEAINTIHTGNLTLKLSGASTATFAAEITALKADLSGASNVTISGSSNNASLEASGASVYHAENLSVGSAVINFSGASSGAIQVQNALSADLSGASNLTYSGNPTVNVNSSGASSINKK